MSLKKSLTGLSSALAALALCTTAAFADTTIEFVQWWEPEMPAGALRGIMNDFEAANPSIKVKLELDGALARACPAVMPARKYRCAKRYS